MYLFRDFTVEIKGSDSAILDIIDQTYSMILTPGQRIYDPMSWCLWKSNSVKMFTIMVNVQVVIHKVAIWKVIEIVDSARS